MPHGQASSVWIYRAEYGWLNSDTQGEYQPQMYGTIGIWGDSGWTTASSGPTNGFNGDGYVTLQSGNTTGWESVFAMSAAYVRAKAKYTELYMGGGKVFLDDREAPTPTGHSSYGVPNGWFKPAGSITTTGSATDAGIGISRYLARISNAAGNPVYDLTIPMGCIGLRGNECPETNADRSLSWNPNSMPNGSQLADGQYTIQLADIDAIGYTTWEASKPLLIDRVAPTVSPGSQLANLNGQTVAGGSYSLSATAPDATSGTTSMLVYDGATQVASSSSGSVSWTFNATTATQGTHTFYVGAADAAGNSSYATYTVTVDQNRYGIAQDTAPGAYKYGGTRGDGSTYSGTGYLPFEDPWWTRLGTKVFRLTAPYNTLDLSNPNASIDMPRVDDLITQATAAGEQVMVTINWWSTDKRGSQHVPSLAEYTTDVGALVTKYPQVALWGPANEPNFGNAWLGTDAEAAPPGISGTTAAHLLANYYQALLSALHGDTSKIVGPDFVPNYDTGYNGGYHTGTADHTSLDTWIADYQAWGGGFGVAASYHPYGDIYRRTTAGLDDYLSHLPSGTKVMFTEAGAERNIWSYPSGSVDDNQTTSDNYLFTTLLNRSSRIIRLYYYSLRNVDPLADWDSALVTTGGAARTPWYAFCNLVNRGSCSP